MLTTVYTYNGIDIKVKSPATPDELGYTVNHPAFEGCKYKLIQEAINSIDNILKGEIEK